MQRTLFPNPGDRDFFQAYRPGARGELHARLTKPKLLARIAEVEAAHGKDAAKEVALTAIEIADLTPSALALAQKLVEGVPGPKRTSPFTLALEEAQSESSPGGRRLWKTEVEKAFDTRQSEDIPRSAIRFALQTASMSQGALTLLQDLLATGHPRSKGKAYASSNDFARGDRFYWQAEGGAPVEVEVLEVFRKKHRVDVTETFLGKLGGTVTLPLTELAVVERASGKTYRLEVEERRVVHRDLSSKHATGKIIGANDDPTYARQTGVHPYSDSLHANVALETIGGELVLRVGGQVLRPGDGVRYSEYGDVEGQGETQFDFWGRIRSIRAGEGGRPEVVVDEPMYPGRFRTRRLLNGELGLLDRVSGYGEQIASDYLTPLPEGQVVRYPKHAKDTSALRIGDQIFTAGDRIVLPTAGRPKAATILTLEQGERGPRVLVRTAAGRARELTKKELAGMRLDLFALLSRHPHADPRPKLEIIHPESGEPFVLLGERKAYPGDLVVFDRCSPGIVPMVIDRIERKGGKDVLWVTEPVPLVPRNDTPSARATIDLAGHEVTFTYQPWPEGSPDGGTPAFAVITRPLADHEIHLMQSEPVRRQKIAGERESQDGVMKRDAAERKRFHELEAHDPKLLAEKYDEHDRERYARKPYVFEKLSGLGVFSIHDLGWALSRAETFLYEEKGLAKVYVRGEPLAEGAGLVERRDGAETPMKILQVTKERLKVEALIGGKTEDRWLLGEDLLFLFPSREAAATIDRKRQRAIAQRMMT
jgi:hypothetical protein